MDINSVSGGQKRSSGSQLDFIGYWADKTIEEAVLLGTQLRQEKPQYIPTRREHDVDYIKPPCSLKNCGRRAKSLKTNMRRHTSGSSSTNFRECSPSRSNKMTKRRSRKSKNKHTCGMRIAELAVPTKRQCLDTWRNKCDTLPALMVDRLRQHVMDLRPIVHISDAIHCFKSKSCKKERMSEKNDKYTGSDSKKTKKLVRTNDIKTLSAIFGHQIAKKLNLPINIKLNSDLQKIANVVSYDIADLICKSRTIDVNNRMNQRIHTEITHKITIWISDVLNETSDKILEDQLIDLEEQVGPALTVVDNLIDGVLDICIPEPEVYEEPSSISEIAFEEEGILEPPAISEKTSSEDSSKLKDEKVYALPETDNIYDDVNTEDYIQNELITMINNINQEADTKSQEYQNLDDGTDSPSVWQSSEDAETKDTNIKRDEFVESEDYIALQTRETAEEQDTNVKHDDFLDSEDVTALPTSENVEEQNADIKNVVYLESKDDIVVLPSEVAEIPPQDTDDINETFADATDENKEPSEDSSDENNKKVKFDKIVCEEKLITEPKSDAGNADWKASIDQMEFAAPNEDLLSDADESWPEGFQPPIVRPSQSVSKSITSLGNINEDEEKLSILHIEISSEFEKQAQDNKVEPLEEKNENIIEVQNRQISPADKVETQPQQESVIESLETPDHKDKIEDKLTKEETAPKKLENPDTVRTPEKEKRISESMKSKSSSKKTFQVAKKKIPIDTRKTKREITPAPKPIPKAKMPIKRKIQSPKTKTEDIEAAGTSKSVKDLDRDDVEKAKDVKFSSLRVKPKPDYRVHADTAPAWIKRTYGEPTCICVNVESKSKVKRCVMGENDIRRWCRDLEKGYENLKIWNDWIDNTSKTVCMLQQEIGALECPEGCANKEWIKLKRNIDQDATLWKKLNRNTRERIQSYKKMYQKRSEVPTESKKFKLFLK